MATIKINSSPGDVQERTIEPEKVAYHKKNAALRKKLHEVTGKSTARKHSHDASAGWHGEKSNKPGKATRAASVDKRSPAHEKPKVPRQGELPAKIPLPVRNSHPRNPVTNTPLAQNVKQVTPQSEPDKAKSELTQTWGQWFGQKLGYDSAPHTNLPNTPVSVGIALFRHGDAPGKGRDENTFKDEIAQTGAKNKYSVNTGQQAVDALVQASKKGEISEFYFASHASGAGTYGDNNSGLYRGGTTKYVSAIVDGVQKWWGGKDYSLLPSKDAATIHDIKAKINSGEIRFAKNAKITFLGCDVAGHPLGIQSVNSFAHILSRALPDAEITAAVGHASPVGRTGTYHSEGENGAPGDWVTIKNGEVIKHWGPNYHPERARH